LHDSKDVFAIVTATSREDATLAVMQVRVLIHGRKSQHPTDAINYSKKPVMSCWCWPEDRDRAIEEQETAAAAHAAARSALDK
jgi:hypothetical protein